MCLSYVSQHKTEASPSHGIGWKIFNNWDKHWRFEYRVYNHTDIVTPNKWLTANYTWVAYGKEQNLAYRSGFHIYLTKPGTHLISRGQKIVKVKWKGPLAVGQQETLPCVVATYMYVPRREQKSGQMRKTPAAHKKQKAKS